MEETSWSKKKRTDSKSVNAETHGATETRWSRSFTILVWKWKGLALYSWCVCTFWYCAVVIRSIKCGFRTQTYYTTSTEPELTKLSQSNKQCACMLGQATAKINRTVATHREDGESNALRQSAISNPSSKIELVSRHSDSIGSWWDNRITIHCRVSKSWADTPIQLDSMN